MSEDLDNNFKKNASKPIQTDVKKMDTTEEHRIMMNQKNITKKSLKVVR